MRRILQLTFSSSILVSVVFALGCARAPDIASTANESRAAAGAGPPLHAGALATTHGTFATLPDKGNLVAYPSAASVRRDGTAHWYRAEVSEDHALRSLISQELVIDTPDGRSIRLAYRRYVEHPNGNWTWVGRNARGEQALITFGDKAVFGSIPDGNRELRLTTRDGLSWVGDVDLSKERQPDSGRPDFLVPPKLAASLASTLPGPAAASAQAYAVGASAAITVDVVLGYTTAYATELGGDSQAVTRLQHLVDVTNQAYANSQIDAQIRLVKTVAVGYLDATSNDDALTKLSGYKSGTGTVPIDPAFNGLRAARDQYGADLVALVRRFRTPENQGCGLAWLIGGNQTGIDTSDARFGYSVVSDDIDRGDRNESDGLTYTCRKESLAHEFGHNMGQNHGVEDAGGDSGVHPYSYGYREASSTGFYTVMAYRLAGSSQRSVRYFANPNVMEAVSGRPTGVANVSDNARSMAQTMPIIALFRSTVVPLDPAVPPVRRLLDANADGRMDLVWHNASSGQLYYWAMNGATIAGGGGGSLALGYSPLAVADFNGDARADVLVSNGGELRMAFAVATGGFAAPVAVAGYPRGWTLAAAGDVNADGRSDLIWQNSTSGELYYWGMNGSAIVGGRGGTFVPAGYTSRGVGDFNADGRSDIVISNGGDVRLVQATAAGSFAAPVTIAGYPGGWTLAGVGDVTADGRADLIWHNSSSGEVYYWAMNGAAIVGGRGGAILPTGYTSRGAGDLNGDGRADLVISNGGDVRALLAGSSGAFAVPLVITGYPGGWTLI